MKIRYSFLTALFAATVFSSTNAGPLFANKDLSFSFDGFCDGMSLHIDTTKGTAVGNRTGCLSGPASGLVAIVVGANMHLGIIMAINGGASGHVTLYVGDNGKWTVFNPNGSVLQNGTWSVGAPTQLNLNAPATGSL